MASSAEYIGYIVNFFDSPFFIIVAGVSTLLMVTGFLYAGYLVLVGILPVLYRLGYVCLV